MTLKRENDLGTISVSDAVISDIILDAVSKPDTLNRIWPSSNGKGIRRLSIITDQTLASNISIEQSDDGTCLEFSVIIKFGTSIKKVTALVADRIHDDVMEKTGIHITKIVINIAGVRSKQIARRNTKVVFDYEVQ